MSTQINQDFFDGCIYGLLPIIFLAIYGTRTAPYLGKIAYLMDDIFVFGLIFIGPFMAMLINENFNYTYINVCISITSTYAFFSILMALVALCIFTFQKICSLFLNNTLLIELPTSESLCKLYTHSLFIALTIYIIFQDAMWFAFSFGTNITTSLYGKFCSVPILLVSLLIFIPYLHIPIKYHFIPITLNLIYQMIWLSLILSNNSYQTKSYLAMTIVAVGRVVFYITDRGDRPSGGILNFISQNTDNDMKSFVRSWRSLLLNVKSEFKFSSK
jgi:hypothetical protein